MEAKIVIEPVVSYICGTVLSRITDFLSSRLQNLKGNPSEVAQVQANLEQCRTIMDILWGFLQDAEQKKKDNPDLRDWLEKLKLCFFDAEDIVEEFNYEGFRQAPVSDPASDELEASSVTSRMKKRLKTLSFFYTSRRTEENRRYTEMNVKLKRVTEELENLKDEKKNFDLLRVPVNRSTRTENSIMTSVSSPSHLEFFGRDKEKHDIISSLLREGEERNEVIAIVGMGGIGKTALAQNVYNDPKVVSHFDKRGWVCVSSEYDVMRISKGLLMSVDPNFSMDLKDKTLDWIQGKLGEELRNKKFLLVLDDNWNEQYRTWTELQPPFLKGNSGSKIIVTSRSRQVAERVTRRNQNIIFLEGLSVDDCWALILTHSGLNRNCSAFSRLEAIGREIALRCSGLPLSAMIVGGMLRNKVREEQWKEILNRKPGTSKDGSLEVMSVLMTSYGDLNPQLKECFGYFALFPEDIEFEKDEVVLQWIGAGLIQSEETGQSYFDELVAKSLVLFSRKSEDFVMHDLVRDLAQVVFGNYRYIGKDGKIVGSFKRTRYLSFHSTIFEAVVKDIVEETADILPLRTFLAQGHSGIILKYSLDDIFLRLKYVRVLRLSSVLNMKELPESVCQLIFLKYIDLSDNKFTKLPSSITSLYNLQIMILKGCSRLEQLPENFGRLINLFHLDLTDCDELHQLPKDMQDMKRLQILLSRFTIGKELLLSSIGQLKPAQRRLEIYGLESVMSSEDAKLAGLYEKRIQEILLHWKRYGDSRCTQVGERDEEIVEQLQHYENLQKLEICCYRGSKLPCWFGSSTTCLTELKLQRCERLDTLQIAMTSLRKLEVYGCSEMVVCLQRMPELKDLVIDECKEVECTETFGLGSLDTCVVVNVATITMGPLFKEKVSLGISNALTLGFGWNRSDLSDISPTTPCWAFDDICLISDEYNENMKVETLLVKHQWFLEHLPKWVYSIMATLRELKVHNCDNMIVNLPRMPVLKKLEIRRCKGVECAENLSLDSLDAFVLQDVNTEMMSALFKEKIKLGWPHAKSLCFGEDYWHDDNAFSVPHWLLPSVSFITDDYNEEIKVEILKVNQISLENIPQWVNAMTSLRELEIFHCPNVAVCLLTMPSLKKLRIKECKEVDCSEAFNLDLLDVFVVEKVSMDQMSALFKEKIRQGCSRASTLHFGGFYDARPSSMPYWALESTCLIEDGYEEEMKFEILKVKNQRSLKHLPQWVSKAKLLKTLTVMSCPSLTVLLPYEDFPPSLCIVEVHGCMALESFGRPLSIERLSVQNCPLIHKKLEDRDEQLCSKIDDIRLNGESSYPVLQSRKGNSKLSSI